MAKEKKLIPVNPGEQEIIKKIQGLVGRKLEQVSEIKWNKVMLGGKQITVDGAVKIIA